MNVVSVFSFLLVYVFSVNSQTLSGDSKPTAYYLKLNVSDLATAPTFSGSIEINVTVVEETSRLVMHADKLNINLTSIQVLRKSDYDGSWSQEPVANVTNVDSLLDLYFNEPILTAEYKISMSFQGYYNNVMKGFAKVGYNFQKSIKYLAVTNFEPTYARSVFPCFDVPSHRTRFVLEITVNMSQMVLTAIKPTSVHNVSDTSKMFLFDKFRNMSVNKLGFVVVEQNTLRQVTTTVGETEIHTRATYPYSNHTSTANKMTADLLEIMGNYTNRPYPLAKLEQIVVPEFFTGTTDSWGCLSYSEESILVSPSITSSRDTQKITLGLARGIAQQWFGGLVSIDSLENQWLMEGFVEYFKYTISALLEETADWELEDQMVLEMVQPALAEMSQHALTPNEATESAEVKAVYDDLTKLKGGAVIRMLHHILADDLFKRSLTVFFKNNAEMTIEPKILWNIMYGGARESKVDLALQSVEGIISGWSNVPGYPTLNVSLSNGQYNISQGSGQWSILVTIMLQGDPKNVKKEWLKPGDSLVIASNSSWILVNINQTGFYRVNYSPPIRNALLKQLRSDPTQFPRLTRAQLVDDMFGLSYSDLVSTDSLLEFTSYMKEETDYYPWYSAFRNFDILLSKLYGHSSYKLLKEYVLSLLTKVVAEVGMASKPEDTHIDKLRRALVLEKACALGHDACLQKASSILRSWMAKTYYDADLSMALLCAGVSNSSNSVWYTVWDMYHYSSVPSVRANILKALTCSSDVTLLKEFLNNITSSSMQLVSPKEKTILLQTFSSTSTGAQILFNWLLETLYAQMNKTNPEESNTTQYSTTSSGSTTPSTTNKSLLNIDSNSGSTSREDRSRERREVPVSRITRVSTLPPILSEEDVTNIISYVLPKLTHLDNGTKLEALLMNDTGMSNTTVQVMRSAATEIYKKDDWARKHNGKITAWLEETASATTPASGVPTDKPTSVTPTTPSVTPSGAETIHSSLAVCTLAVVLHYRLML